ncbi:MAG: hypothetical protein WC679_02215 [Bacteroidales bacterium]|jgi:hypothetical protein
MMNYDERIKLFDEFFKSIQGKSKDEIETLLRKTFKTVGSLKKLFKYVGYGKYPDSFDYEDLIKEFFLKN